MPVGGGEPRRLATSYDYGGRYSPDSKRIAFFAPPEVEGHSRMTCIVIPASGGEPLATLSLPPHAHDFRWTPDGRALTFISDKEGVHNVLRQPIAGAEPQALTSFGDGQIDSHAWLPKVDRLVLTRRSGQQTNLWIVAADGRDPVALTDFVAGSVFEMEPTPDGKNVVFTYGNESLDVALIRGFR